MKNFLTLLLFFLPLITFGQLQVSQKLKVGSRSQHHILYTKRGDVFLGKVAVLDSGACVFVLADSIGILRLNMSEIASISIDKQYQERNFKSENLDLTDRISFSPTAFTLKRGEAEYHNEMLFLNSFEYGLRDNYTVGVGTFLLPGNKMSWVKLKYSLKMQEEVHIAFGSLLGFGFDMERSFDNKRYLSRLILPYGALTLGSRDKFFNIMALKALAATDEGAEWTPCIYGVGWGAKTSKGTRFFGEIGSAFKDDIGLIGNIGLSVLGRRSNTNIGLMFGGGGGIPSFSYVRRL